MEWTGERRTTEPASAKVGFTIGFQALWTGGQIAHTEKWDGLREFAAASAGMLNQVRGLGIQGLEHGEVYTSGRCQDIQMIIFEMLFYRFNSKRVQQLSRVRWHWCVIRCGQPDDP